MISVIIITILFILGIIAYLSILSGGGWSE